MSRSDKKPSKARKKQKVGPALPAMPQSVIDEIRAIRSDSGDKLPDRGIDRSWSPTDHALQCSICGELGEHPCLPVLHQVIEQSDEMAAQCWSVFRQLEKLGYFVVEEGASQLIGLEDMI